MGKNKEQQVKEFGYYITGDTNFQSKRYNLPPGLSSQLESLAIASYNKKDWGNIKTLTRLIDEYPGAPMLKNYLSVAYHNMGLHDKAVEINNQLAKDHPEYLFAKLNLANDCIEKGKLEKVPEILGEELEIKALYPEREVFHIAEITNYYKVIIRYFVALENLELAENRLELLQDLAPGHPDTEDAETYLFPLQMKFAAQRMEKERKEAIVPRVVKTVPKSSVKKPLQFTHPQVPEYLYNCGLDIPSEYLQELIKLPRTSFIADLENVLTDAVNRYYKYKRAGWKEGSCNFVLHSLFLLKEVNAAVSLPKVLEFLEYDYDFLDFWLGDHITETIWQCIYTLGFGQTAILKQYMMKSGIGTYSKNAVSEALCQMVLHQPKKREEILSIYAEVFRKFECSTPADNFIDSDFLGLAVGDVIDCNLHELLPQIQTLYDKKYVAVGINGTYNEVVKAFKNIRGKEYKREIYSIYELYEHVLNTWAGHNEEPDEDEEDSGYPYEKPGQAVSEKIGRNEPCPCGSGKKYKKCCMNKS